MSLTFSIVINTYNRAESLARTLRSLAYLRYPRYEVIVVPGPCTDHTEQVLAQWRGRIRVGQCPVANLSVSRNIGIVMAAGDIVAFTDDDGLPEANWLDTLAAAYAADPGLGAVGGYVRDHTGVAYQARHIHCNRWGEALFFDKETPVQDGWFPSLIGVNSSFRRQALCDIGGFDEEYAYFLDETDVCLRLLERGWRVRTIAGAEVHHAYAPSHLRNRERVPTSLRLTARSKLYYALRHLPPPHHPLETIRRVRTELHATVDHLLAARKIDAPTAHRLHAEVAQGCQQAIFDAHAHPAGRTIRISPAPVNDFAPLQRHWPLLDPHEPPPARQRVLLISRAYPPLPVGGIARYTHTLAQALAQRGHEVHVIAQTPDQPRTDFEDGVWIHRIAPLPPGALPRQPDRPPLPESLRTWTAAVAACADDLRQRLGVQHAIAALWDVEAYDLIAQPGWTVYTYLVTSYALNLPHKPDWRDHPHYIQHHIQPVIQAEAWALRHSHALLASTHAIWRDVQQHYPSLALDPISVYHVPFGLPDDPEVTACPAPEPDATPDRAHCHVLYVGRCEPRKGIDLVLAAIAQLAPQHPHTHWHLVGDDTLPISGAGQTYRQHFLQQHAGAAWLSRVHWHGQVSDVELLRHYRDCDIFIAPSRYESFGLIYVEAMRAGKPCIGGRQGGAAEVLHDDACIAIDTDGPEPLIAALQALIGDVPQRQRMGRAGRARYQQHYSAAAFARRIEAVLSAAATPL